MIFLTSFAAFASFVFLTAPASSKVCPAPDTPFVQEYRIPSPTAGEAPREDVRAIAVDIADNVWVATGDGIRVLVNGSWQNPSSNEEAGPAFCAVADKKGNTWLGAWNGLYCGNKEGNLKHIEGIEAPISAIVVSVDKVIALGPDGKWEWDGTSWRHTLGNLPQDVRAATFDSEGTLWLATGHGLFRLKGDTVIAEYHNEDEIRTGDLYGVACAPDGRIWSSGLGGMDVYEHGKRVQCYSPNEGLPSFETRHLTFDTQGRLWIATPIGAVRFDGRNWALRHSQRWIPSDDVRQIAFDSQGRAWIATAKGISVIATKTMTLADKAAHYLTACLERHVRPPYLVEKCLLRVPGDLSTWYPRDDDNDGQYTAMYLAMEAFRYAATHDPEARENARKAYEALEFLQQVTGTNGFVARTVVPVEWTQMNDANRTYTPQEYAEERVRDPRWKKVEKRWRPSADGKWLWKGDTSSDEITGHFYGYLMYYDLVADEGERERVRAHVRRVMDYIIEGDFALRDIDGKPTRWAVWTPDVLLHDPDWRAERPGNCAEILSFLNATHHITGDPKYREISVRLAKEYGFADIVRRPKPTAPSERTHIDAELLALVFPGLIQYETDPELRAKYLEGLDFWMNILRDECSPLYGFVYGALGDKDFRMADCISFLRTTPLDLVEWTVDNTKRDDVRLVRYPEPDSIQTDRLLPADERGIIRWDNNPYAAVQGENGRVESSGVFWLLPYWMGRYYGFILPPSR